jgi:hypothetical protein
VGVEKNEELKFEVQTYRDVKLITDGIYWIP